MKRTVIILLVAVCLVSFAGVSFLAQENSSPREIWMLLTAMEKASYLRGLRDGITECLSYLVTMAPTDDKEMEMAMDEMVVLVEFIWGNGRPIVELMDNLFRDPVNENVQWPWMCMVACGILEGQDVEQMLKEARKEGHLNPLMRYQKYKEKK